ncbi:MAG TPA: hypothetical protein OIM20_06575 [Eggerthellaceae bacterium]|nr:hypothetical protein [Eggerthellaceae bacterium]
MSNFEIISVSNRNISRSHLIASGEPSFADFFEALDFEFDESVDKASRFDYGIAAGSGFITGLLSVLLGKPLSIEEASKIGGKEADKIVIETARSLGCKLPKEEAIFGKESRCGSETLANAIKFLEGKFPIPQDKLTAEFGGGLQHHLRDYAHHPTILGLFFSILTQFTGVGYGTDTAGNLIKPPLPTNALIGKNIPEKIAIGTFNWLFHLISDIDGSHVNAGKGTGIPGPLLSTLKELSATPLFQNIKFNYKESEISFSQWLSKLFNGTYFKDSEGKSIRFDFRTEMGLATQLIEESLFVLANEVIIRVFYTVTRLASEIKTKNISSLRELNRLNPKSFIPIKSRALTRMCTVASGTFIAINTAGIAIKAGITSRGNTGAFVSAFFLNVNYPGIGRFAIACFFDAGYIKEDISAAYEKAMKEHEEAKYKREDNLKKLSDKYKFLTLNKTQTKLLCSFESMMVAFDILNTKKEEDARLKTLWLKSWEENVCESLGVDRKDFFIRSGKQAFDLMNMISGDINDRSWIDLIVLELSQFNPYFQLGEEKDKSFKKLKMKVDYLSDVFCKGQDYINENDIKSIRKAYSAAVRTVTGNRKKVVVAAAATAAATVATAGGALAFAPQIAILIAGDAVVGLSGAALTSASLAFVGGGSLAVGGLGMAGGTAILTGGGALIGLTGSGITTAATVMFQSSEAFVQSECSKLLAFCKEIALKKYGRTDIVSLAHEGISNCIAELESEIEKLSDTEEKPDKKLISQMKKSLKCMNRCENALLKLTVKSSERN